MQKCRAAADRAVMMVVCTEGGSCYGLMSLAADGEKDLRSALACVMRIPVGIDRCADDHFTDKAGYRVDRFRDNLVFAFIAPSAPAGAGALVPGAAAPNLGPAVEGVDLILP